MEALPTLGCRPHLHLRVSLPHASHIRRRRRLCHHHHRATLSGSLSSVFFKTPLSSPSFSAKASNSDSLSPNPSSSSCFPFSVLRLPLCAAAAAAALFFCRFSPFRPLPALAEVPAAETVMEEAHNGGVPDKGEQQEDREDAEEERELEEKLASNPNDVTALKSLVEFKMRSRKLPEVVEIASKLVELEPDEVEWRLLRGHTYCYMGEYELAKSGFEEILAENPNQVEAYHGLVMSATQLDVDNGKDLGEVEKRIQEAMARLRKEKKKEEVREFYLLIAQVRVIQGDYLAALNVYQDLVKEEPRDYRPYLCQGIIYALLRKKEQAEEQFEKYKRLVPEEHPYANYFEDNMKNTAKVFSEAGEK